jgi:hypothetical protein
MAVTTFYFPLDFLWSIAFPQELVTPAEPHAGGRHTYSYDVLPGVLKGLFAIQPCSFRTMPHMFVVVDQSPIHCPSMWPSSVTRMPRTGFWRLFGMAKVVYYINPRIHKDW